MNLIPGGGYAKHLFLDYQSRVKEKAYLVHIMQESSQDNKSSKVSLFTSLFCSSIVSSSPNCLNHLGRLVNSANCYTYPNYLLKTRIQNHIDIFNNRPSLKLTGSSKWVKCIKLIDAIIVNLGILLKWIWTELRKDKRFKIRVVVFYSYRANCVLVVFGISTTTEMPLTTHFYALASRHTPFLFSCNS